jgi:hypothetical protein
MPTVDWMDGMDYGKGFNSVTGTVRGKAVNHHLPSTIPDVSGQKVLYSILKITSFQDFESALSVEISASGSYGMYSGSAMLNFAESRKLNSYTEYLVARVTVENPTFSIHDVALTIYANDLLKSGTADDLKTFKDHFGDYFIEGIKTGGAFYAVLEFSSTSEESQRQTRSSLNAGMQGLASSFDASAKFSENLKNLTKDVSLQVYAYQAGGEGPQSTDVDKIVQKASNFQNEVKDKAIPIQAVIMDYGSLETPASPNMIEIEKQRNVIARLRKLRNTTLNTLNDIDYIQNHPEQFIITEEHKLSDKRKEIEKALDNIYTSASACQNDVNQCNFQTPDIQVELPKRKELLKVLDPPSLTEYLKDFQDIPSGLRMADEEMWEIVLREMRDMGITSVDQFDGMIKSIFDFKKRYKKVLKSDAWVTYPGIIRNALIIYDTKKYTAQAYQLQYYDTFEFQTYMLFKEFGVNFHDLPPNVKFDEG